MGKSSAKKGSKRSKVNEASQRRLVKAQTAAANAKRNVAIATKQLNEAVRALIHSQAGSSKEAQSAKHVRAVTKDLVAARKRLRKAEKKRKKVAARLLKTTTRTAREGSNPGGSRKRAARKAAPPAPKKRPHLPGRAMRKPDVVSTAVTAGSPTGGAPNSEAIALLVTETSHPED